MKLATSDFGTFETYSDVRSAVASRGKLDISRTTQNQCRCDE